MAQADKIDEFIHRIKFLYEPEYGDFKRKVGLYLDRLQQEIGPKAREPRVRDSFEQIKTLIIYQPKDNVEAARQETLSWAKQLKAVTKTMN